MEQERLADLEASILKYFASTARLARDVVQAFELPDLLARREALNDLLAAFPTNEIEKIKEALREQDFLDAFSEELLRGATAQQASPGAPTSAQGSKSARPDVKRSVLKHFSSTARLASGAVAASRLLDPRSRQEALERLLEDFPQHDLDVVKAALRDHLAPEEALQGRAVTEAAEAQPDSLGASGENPHATLLLAASRRRPR